MSVTASSLRDELQALGLEGSDLANIAGFPDRTVTRWLNGTAVPSLRTRSMLANLKKVLDKLAEVYSPDEARRWLYARHPLLDQARPNDLIRRGQAERVLSVLDGLTNGAYP